MHNPRGDSMRQRLTPYRRRLQTGTFLRTNSVHVVEVLGGTPMQFAVCAGHTACGGRSIDLMGLAARVVAPRSAAHAAATRQHCAACCRTRMAKNLK